MKKTLSEIQEEIVPYEQAQQTAIATRKTVAEVRKELALDAIRDGKASTPLSKDLASALKDEAGALRKLDAARMAREAAAAVEDEWTLLVEQLDVLKKRRLQASQEIDQARAGAATLRMEVAVHLGASGGYVDVAGMAGRTATLESAIPIMETAQAELEADVEQHITTMRQFANQNSVPRDVVP